MEGKQDFRQNNQDYHNSLSKRILVLDDDAFSRSMFQHVIKSADPRAVVECVSTVDEAMIRLRDGSRFDLIISDYALSGEYSGFEFWLIVQGFNQYIPFVLASGHTKEHMHRIFEGGPAFVSKAHVAREIPEVLNSLD